MKIEETKKENLRIEYKVTLSEKEQNDFEEKSITKTMEDVKLKGFRKGKAPREQVLSFCQREIVENTLDKIKEEIRKKLEARGVSLYKPVINQESALEFKCICEFFPEIPNAESKMEGLYDYDVQIEKEHIMKRIYEQKSLLRSRKVALIGDNVTLTISFKGKRIKKEINVDHGSLSQKIIGMAEGEEKKISIKEDETLIEEIPKNEKAKIKIKLTKLNQDFKEDLSDEIFAQKIGYKNLKEYIEKEKQIMENIARMKSEDIFFSLVIGKNNQKFKVKVPESMLEYEKKISHPHEIDFNVMQRIYLLFFVLKKSSQLPEEVNKFLSQHSNKLSKYFAVMYAQPMFFYFLRSRIIEAIKKENKVEKKKISFEDFIKLTTSVSIS